MDRRYYLFFIALICLLIFFQLPYFALYPTSIHAWAQSDLLSMSHGFLRNGFDLFHPETFTYNKEFPDMWRTTSETTITSSNLAIHQYLVALLMKLFGTTEAVIYRVYVFSCSAVGIFYLFKLAHFFKLKPIFALLGASLMTFSPIYLYYQANFLITIPVLTTTIFGIYYYLNFLVDGSHKKWILAFVFLTLSALTRTTFIIPLIALCCHQILIYFQTKTIQPKRFIIPTVCFLLIAIFFYYNAIIREEHGSIFLNSIRPAKNFQNFLDCIYEINLIWNGHYFSGLTKFVIGFVLLAILILPATTEKWNYRNPLFFLLIFFFGTILFFFAMVQQFVYHDYYFIDSLFLPLILLCFLGLKKIQELKLATMYSATPMMLLGFIYIGFSAFTGREKLTERYIQWANDDVTKTINAFHNSHLFLQKHGVPKDAKIMVFGCYGPNAPFLMMDRKGYCIDFTKQKEVESALTWDIDYVVISNFYLTQRVLPEMSFLTEHLIPIATNFEITLFKLGKNRRSLTLIELLNLDERDFTYYSIASSSSNDSNWDFLEKATTSDPYFTINPNVESGFRWLNKDSKLKKLKNPKKLFFEAKVLINGSSNFSPIDVFVLQNNKAVLYKSYTFDGLQKDSSRWQTIQILEDLPQNLTGKYDFGLQQNNVNHSNFKIDSLIIGIY